MNNGDYTPLDQAVIDREVERMDQERASARDLLKVECKDAGGNTDIIVFKKTKRLIKALDEMRLCWYEIDGDLYVNRHEIDDVIKEFKYE